eukprot:CAMPEP_0197678746 /NCGR_PEP_ID=MMETSP1338-20131121/90556_1 /TAXON_ID=43686 ORGANISM="Pelagodinium beii, Strain RCC1491" /NCGR_SAMPLE_ID=MMETSP1338 /ASSEMBLY_ACC=CAM_ASM_000754 /LENGTH=112 /DNA_ID=CAMNT_0043259719 /DNA_START=44 /DNA_END=379 /DNA_ORIENTATION=-
MEEMESRYHGMTCQAKSMYQLTCLCGHDATMHSQTPGGARFFEEEPNVWRVIQGLCFRKDGVEPANAPIKKSKRAIGEQLLSTGRCWLGPSGGMWAELEPSKHGVGWALVEG